MAREEKTVINNPGNGNPNGDSGIGWVSVVLIVLILVGGALFLVPRLSPNGTTTGGNTPGTPNTGGTGGNINVNITGSTTNTGGTGLGSGATTTGGTATSTR